MIFQDTYFYYLRKPAGRPTTWWTQECFLDKLESGIYEEYLQAYHHSEWYDDMLYQYFHMHYNDRQLTKVADVHALVHYLTHTFSHNQEYGLVNRLDNDTAGFLYFAKDVYTYTHWAKRQEQGRIKKQYLALVRGDMTYLIDHPEKTDCMIEGNTIQVTYPLMHHGQLDDRMVCLRSRKDMAKWRGKVLEKTSKITVLDYNSLCQKTLVHIEIEQGARHQIRMHLAALGYPILGEKIYDKAMFRQDRLPLHLWSIGCDIRAHRDVLERFYRLREKVNQPVAHLPWDHSERVM